MLQLAQHPEADPSAQPPVAPAPCIALGRLVSAVPSEGLRLLLLVRPGTRSHTSRLSAPRAAGARRVESEAHKEPSLFPAVRLPAQGERDDLSAALKEWAASKGPGVAGTRSQRKRVTSRCS